MKYQKIKNKNSASYFLFTIIGICLFFFCTRSYENLRLPLDGYLEISFNLINKGVFSLSPPNLDKPPIPTMRRAPGYPYFLGAILKIFNLDELQKKCLVEQKDCNVFLKKKSFIFCLVCILSIIFLFRTCQKLGASYNASLVVSIVSMVIVSKEMIINYNSETFGLFLFSLSSYFLACFIKTQNKSDMLFFSIFLSLLILTRNVFLYFIPFFIIVLLLFGFEKKSSLKQKLTNFIIFFLSLTLFILPWILRNNFFFNSYSIAESGSVKVLSNRLEHNNMSNREFYTGILYWAPIPGVRALVEKNISSVYWRRFDTKSEESFRVTGRINAANLVSEKNYSQAKIYLLKKILSDPLQNFKISILMGWRGLKYCFIFFPFFILFLIKNNKRKFYISIFSLTIFNFLFHSLFTHFNVRYGYPMVYGFAVSTALYFSMRSIKWTKF